MPPVAWLALRVAQLPSTFPHSLQVSSCQDQALPTYSTCQNFICAKCRSSSESQPHHIFVFAYAISSFLASRLQGRDRETRRAIVKWCDWRHEVNRSSQVPGLSFLPASDGIWMHAKAIIGRLVHDACCNYMCSCNCSGTTAAAPKCLCAMMTLQTVPLCNKCHRAQGLYAVVVVTQGSGS